MNASIYAGLNIYYSCENIYLNNCTLSNNHYAGVKSYETNYLCRFNNCDIVNNYIYGFDCYLSFEFIIQSCNILSNQYGLFLNFSGDFLINGNELNGNTISAIECNSDYANFVGGSSVYNLCITENVFANNTLRSIGLCSARYCIISNNSIRGDGIYNVYGIYLTSFAGNETDGVCSYIHITNNTMSDSQYALGNSSTNTSAYGAVFNMYNNNLTFNISTSTLVGDMSSWSLFTIPLTNGSSGQLLQTDGSGFTSWIGPKILNVGTTVDDYTGSTTYDPTTHYCVITPSNSSATIQIILCGNLLVDNITETGVCSISRDGSVLNSTGFVKVSQTTPNYFSISIFDTPATTSPVTYTVVIKVLNGTSNVRYNNVNTTCTLTCFEVR